MGFARKAAGVLIATMVLGVMPIATAATASADTAGLLLLAATDNGQCHPHEGPYEVSAVCLHIDSSGVWGSMWDGDKDGYNDYIKGTVFTQQCTGPNTNCIDYSANGTTGYGNGGLWYLRTSAKSVDAHFVYRACASLENYSTGFSWIYSCTDYVRG